LERKRAFGDLRGRYGFSEYDLHDAAKGLNCAWIADHVDAVLAQTPASRAYRALNRMCLGQARRVRFRSRSRGIGSLENKRNDTGLRFVLQQPEEGNAGYLLWHGDRLPALIDWEDPVVTCGLAHPIKYARLVVRQASSARAQGVDQAGQRYVVQLALSGVPFHKPKHQVGSDTVGLDLGPSTLAIVPREGTPRLELLCSELAPDAKAIRRLQRQMDRQRRANNPENYDAQGRIKKGGKGRLSWKHSKRSLATRRRKATRERRLAAHRKSLHGRLVHEIVAVGNTVITEQVSYRAWQKQFGKSVGLRAPGMFIALLKRTGASHGQHPARSLHTQHQTLAVLSWLRPVCTETVVAALAHVSLWYLGPARPLLRISSVPSRSTRVSSLVCPAAVRRQLGRSGARPAGSIRVRFPTCECEAAGASQHHVSPETEHVCLKVQAE
jgi:hypothetical protein